MVNALCQDSLFPLALGRGLATQLFNFWLKISDPGQAVLLNSPDKCHYNTFKNIRVRTANGTGGRSTMTFEIFGTGS